MEAAPRVPPGFWPFADKSDIRPAERSAESSPDFVGHETRSIRRFSSAVEQRFCKPKVGSSILSTGTSIYNGFSDYCSPRFEQNPRKRLVGLHWATMRHSHPL